MSAKLIKVPITKNVNDYLEKNIEKSWIIDVKAQLEKIQKFPADGGFVSSNWKIGRINMFIGFFTINKLDISMFKGIGIPNDSSDKRCKYESTRLQISIPIKIKDIDNTVSQSQLELSRFLSIIHKYWMTKADEISKIKAVKMDKRDIHNIVNYTKSDVEKTPLKTPMANMKLMMVSSNADEKTKKKGYFSPTYPIGVLQGKRKTIIFDYLTQREVSRDNNGNPIYEYDEMKYIDDEGNESEINADNVHYVLTANTIIHGITFGAGGVCVSGSWISSPLEVLHLIIERSSGNEFGNEINDDDLFDMSVMSSSLEKINGEGENDDNLDNDEELDFN